MAGFEPRSSGVKSDHSGNFGTPTQMCHNLLKTIIFKIKLALIITSEIINLMTKHQTYSQIWGTRIFWLYSYPSLTETEPADPTKRPFREHSWLRRATTSLGFCFMDVFSPFETISRLSVASKSDFLKKTKEIKIRRLSTIESILNATQ